MSLTCPVCYSNCRDGARFCNKCGKHFEQPGLPPPTAPLEQCDVQTPSAGYGIQSYSPQMPIDMSQIKELEKKAREIVRFFSIVAGALTLLWLPFVDLFFLLPLLCYMVITIARIFGQKLSVDMAKELVMTCFAGAIGFLGSYACGKFIPIIGGILTAPVIFACTYGIGDVAIAYFSQEGKISRAQMRDIYNSSFQNSRNHYSGNLNEARESLENIKEHLSPEEYERLKKKLG